MAFAITKLLKRDVIRVLLSWIYIWCNGFHCCTMLAVF